MNVISVAAFVVLYVAAAGTVMAQDDAFGFTKTIELSDMSVPAKDTNGDGCIEPSEVTPGGQLAKRFATRDTNGDGKLCKDEYFVP